MAYWSLLDSFAYARVFSVHGCFRNPVRIEILGLIFETQAADLHQAADFLARTIRIDFFERLFQDFENLRAAEGHGHGFAFVRNLIAVELQSV